MARSNGTKDSGTGTEDFGSLGDVGSISAEGTGTGSGSTGTGRTGRGGTGRNRSSGRSGANASTATRTKAAEPQPEVVLEDTLSDLPTFRPGKKLSKAEKLALSRAWADRMCDLASRIGVNLAGAPMEARSEYERQYITALAAMTQQEKQDIVKPLSEILAETKAIAVAGPWANPVSLVLASGAYLSHVYMVYLLMHPDSVPFWMRLFKRKAPAQPEAAAPEGVEMYGAWAAPEAPGEVPGEVAGGEVADLSARGIDHVLGVMKRD